MATTTQAPPTAADVDAAVPRLAGIAVRTPLINSAVLDAAVGARVFLKAETLQRPGSFKFGGAYNRMSQIPEAERAGGEETRIGQRRRHRQDGSGSGNELNASERDPRPPRPAPGVR